MYRCKWCGAVFSRPDEISADHEYPGRTIPTFMVHQFCPVCGDDSIEEVFFDEEDDDELLRDS